MYLLILQPGTKDHCFEHGASHTLVAMTRAYIACAAHNAWPDEAAVVPVVQNRTVLEEIECAGREVGCERLLAVWP
jgi:hypothetical protein